MKKFAFIFLTLALFSTPIITPQNSFASGRSAAMLRDDQGFNQTIASFGVFAGRANPNNKTESSSIFLPILLSLDPDMVKQYLAQTNFDRFRHNMADLTENYSPRRHDFKWRYKDDQYGGQEANLTEEFWASNPLSPVWSDQEP